MVCCGPSVTGQGGSIHYLDDFLFFRLPESQQCAESLSKALARCDLMGVPLAPAKAERPSTKLVFLGIEVDIASLTFSLPQPKLCQLQRTIQVWGDKGLVPKRELLSNIG